MSSSGNPILKNSSLFALFCLSYLPLFFLLVVKIIIDNKDYLVYDGFTMKGLIIFVKKFSFLSLLLILCLYAYIGTKITLGKIQSARASAYPVNVNSIKPKNEESLSYLITYVIPLLTTSFTGLYEIISFIVLFVIYFKLYSSSSLIIINPILNMKYGLYELDYKINSNNIEIKNALIISQRKWIDEGDELELIKLNHRIYFAF